MPLKESEAIILRTFPLAEADRIVSFLDRQAGRVRGVAKAARRPKSRFGSTLEPLSYVRIWYYERENRDLVQINQCELIESFLDVQGDYEAGVCLALISEVTEGVLHELEPAERQFRLDLLCAREIKRRGASKVILGYFSLWTARLSGWLGPLDNAALSKEALLVAKSMLASPLEHVLGEYPEGAGASEILDYALDILERHMEKKLSTRQALNSIERSKRN